MKLTFKQTGSSYLTAELVYKGRVFHGASVLKSALWDAIKTTIVTLAAESQAAREAAKRAARVG